MSFPCRWDRAGLAREVVELCVAWAGRHHRHASVVEGGLQTTAITHTYAAHCRRFGICPRLAYQYRLGRSSLARLRRAVPVLP